MEENKKNAVSQETSLIDDEKMNESNKNTLGQIAPEPSQEPKHSKDILKKVLIAAGILIVCVGGYFVYSQYQAAQEARRIDVVIDTETKEVPYGTDLMSLITVNKADDIVMKLVDADGNEVTEPKANTEYTIVYVATASDNSKEFKHTIVFIDKTAPVISGVEDYKEIAFGSEFDPLNGVSAFDDVDGEINVMVEGDSVDTKSPKEYSLIYKAIDLSDNEASIESTVKVLEPTCGANATWNGEDCVCNSGYTGDAWNGCTVIKKTNSNSSSGNQTGNSNNPSWDNNSSQSWNDDQGSYNDASSSSGGSWSSGGNSWTVDIPDQNDINNIHNQGNSIYGDGNSWGATIVGDDVYWWE